MTDTGTDRVTAIAVKATDEIFELALQGAWSVFSLDQYPRRLFELAVLQRNLRNDLFKLQAQIAWFDADIAANIQGRSDLKNEAQRKAARAQLERDAQYQEALGRRHDLQQRLHLAEDLYRSWRYQREQLLAAQTTGGE